VSASSNFYGCRRFRAAGFAAPARAASGHRAEFRLAIADALREEYRVIIDRKALKRPACVK
jgi:hypothetical protein